MLVKVIEQGKHCGVFSLLGEGTHGVRRVIKKEIMAQKGCQGSLTKHTQTSWVKKP